VNQKTPNIMKDLADAIKEMESNPPAPAKSKQEILGERES